MYMSLMNKKMRNTVYSIYSLGKNEYACIQHIDRHIYIHTYTCNQHILTHCSVNILQ